MKAMIFAAGLGTRLRPLTDTLPKALVPVAGKPLLQHVVDKLLGSGCTELVINVHHLAEQIYRYVEEHQHFGIPVHFSDETALLLETGGAIKKAAPLLQGDAPFLIHNVDILSNVDLARFYADNKDYPATLLVSPRETQRYLLFDPETHRLKGWTNLKTGEVKTPYPNLDVEKCEKYAFSGIHLFSPQLFPRLEVWPEKFSIIDFYLSICHEVEIHADIHPDLRLMDVGKVDTLAQAEDFLANN
jgi:NDP-sugar pyrophosphorylase family protein